MPRYFSVRPTLSMKGRKFKGIRGFAGKPFHPPLTDVPVTCYILAATFDLLSYIAAERGAESGTVAKDFFVSGTHVLIFGAIASVPTALTGFWDWLKSTPKYSQAWRTANVHMAIMLTVTAIVIVDILMRLSSWDDGRASLGITVISVGIGALVALGATYGGTLVYEYGFNVETAEDSPVWHRSEEDVIPGREPL